MPLPYGRRSRNGKRKGKRRQFTYQFIMAPDEKHLIQGQIATALKGR